MPWQQWKTKEIANSREITRQKYWPQFSASKGKMSTVYLKHLCSYCLNLCIHIFPHFHVICPFFSPKHVSKPKCNLLTCQFSHSLFFLFPLSPWLPHMYLLPQKKPQLLLQQDMCSSIRYVYFPTHLKRTDLLSDLSLVCTSKNSISRTVTTASF